MGREHLTAWLMQNAGAVSNTGKPEADNNYGRAAALIASQARRVKELEGSLEPFAAIADEYSDSEDDAHQVWKDFDVLGATLPLHHFRRARATLKGETP